jgi:hypothetical protein
VDAAGNEGPLATRNWVVDATPPLVTAISTTDSGGGNVRVSFTVTDVRGATISHIDCRMDGAPFAICRALSPVGFVDYELSPGSHTFEVYAVDEFGNTGHVGVSSPNLPTPFARRDLSVTTGPGHLVVIGNDYTDQDPNGVSSWQAQLLVNAVTLSPALGFSRGVNLLAVRAPSDVVDQSEIDNVTASLKVPLDTGVYREISNLANVPTELPGADVLLIYDQNGADASVFASTLEPTLRAFLDAGGVVVVLDGIYDEDKQATSDTYRVLASSLLDIQAAVSTQHMFETRFNCEGGDPSWIIPCNVADPIRGSTRQTRLPVQICDGGVRVGYVSDEPWVFYATMSFPEEDEPDHVGVFHKWFGTVDPAVGGPVAITVVPEPGYFPGDHMAVFQDAASEVLQVCSDYYGNALDPPRLVMQNGGAVFHMTGGGYASSGYYGYDDDYDFFGNLMTTYVGVQPLDDLRSHLIPAFDPNPEEGEEVVVGFPGDLDPNNVVQVSSGCGIDVWRSGSGTMSLRTCGRGSYSLVAEAVNPQTQRIARYTILNGVSQHFGGQVNLPNYSTWSVPNRSVTLAPGTLTGQVQSVEMAVTQSVGPLHYLEGDTVYNNNTVGLGMTFYSAAGTGSPPMDHLAHLEGLRYPYQCDDNFGCIQPVVDRVIRGALNVLASGTIALDAISWLPRLSMTGQPTVDDSTGQLKFGANLSGSLGSAIRGGKAVLYADDFQKKWTIIFPVEGTTGSTGFSSAPLPPDLDVTDPDCESFQLACDFWPLPDEDEPRLQLFELVEQSNLSGYDDYRRLPVYPEFMRAPAPGNYTRRSTKLFQSQTD